jgi:hypothetical protein
MAGKSWDDVMNGEEPNQDEIHDLYTEAMKKIHGARRSTSIAQEQIRILQGICDHSRHKAGSGGCCPDCGADFSPD